MYTYELHQARRAELQRNAEHWRLVQQAKAARAAERRARRSAELTGARSATRTSARADVEGAESAESAESARGAGSAGGAGGAAGASAAGHRAPRPIGRLGHAARFHRANHRTAA